MKADITKSELVKYIFINRRDALCLFPQVCKKFGYNSAAFLGYVVDKYFREKNQLEWLSISVNEVEDQIYLTREEQDSCIKALNMAKILQKKTAGLPPTRHFKLDMELLAGVLTSSEN
jgi:hypothetical protein